MSEQPIWVTGAGGLIGNHIVQEASAFNSGSKVIGLTRPQLDLSDFNQVDRLFARDSPRFIIHCAAMSRSPDCQAAPALARRMNVEVTKHLAQLSFDRPFFFFSTDLVFDGRKGHYDEGTSVNPLSVYAETKVEAEQEVLSNARHTVIRTSLNGGTSPTGDRGFNEQMRRAWASGQALTFFTDEFRSPIHSRATAQAVWKLTLANKPGIYHIAGTQRLSRWEIGRLVAERCAELNPKIKTGSLQEYKGAPRAPDTSLNCDKVQQLLNIRLLGLAEWLEHHPQELF